MTLAGVYGQDVGPEHEGFAGDEGCGKFWIGKAFGAAGFKRTFNCRVGRLPQIEAVPETAFKDFISETSARFYHQAVHAAGGKIRMHFVPVSNERGVT